MRTNAFGEHNENDEYIYLLLFSCILVVLRQIATELVHRLPPAIVVKYTGHWTSPHPKAKDSLHILQCDGHLAKR